MQLEVTLQAKKLRSVALQEPSHVYFIASQTAMTAAAGLSISFKVNQLLEKEATDLVEVKRDYMKEQVYIKSNL